MNSGIKEMFYVWLCFVAGWLAALAVAYFFKL